MSNTLVQVPLIEFDNRKIFIEVRPGSTVEETKKVSLALSKIMREMITDRFIKKSDKQLIIPGTTILNEPKRTDKGIFAGG